MKKQVKFKRSKKSVTNVSKIPLKTDKILINNDLLNFRCIIHNLKKINIIARAFRPLINAK